MITGEGVGLMDITLILPMEVMVNIEDAQLLLLPSVPLPPELLHTKSINGDTDPETGTRPTRTLITTQGERWQEQLLELLPQALLRIRFVNTVESLDPDHEAPPQIGSILTIEKQSLQLPRLVLVSLRGTSTIVEKVDPDLLPDRHQKSESPGDAT